MMYVVDLVHTDIKITVRVREVDRSSLRNIANIVAHVQKLDEDWNG